MQFHEDAHPEDILAMIWENLGQAPEDPSTPIRTPVLCTRGEDGVHARVVVLRAARPSERSLECYTDVRSRKVSELRHDPHVEWVFYDPYVRVQVRARGATTLFHDNTFARRCWEALHVDARKDYMSLSTPGHPLPEEEGGHHALQLEASEDDLEKGRSNFAVVVTTVERIDWLQLGTHGHRRATFKWSGEHFVGHWIVP